MNEMPISCIGCIASVPIKWIEVKEVIYVVEYVSGGGGGDGFLPITFSSLVLLLLVYRMLNEQLEKVNREASDFRLQNAKLASQVSEHSLILHPTDDHLLLLLLPVPPSLLISLVMSFG